MSMAAMSRITEGPCDQTPLHHTHPSEAEVATLTAETAVSQDPTIAIMGALREDKGLALTAQVIAQVLHAAPRTVFRLQAADEPAAADLRRALAAAGVEAGAQVHRGPLATNDYCRRLLTSDL